MGQALYRTHRPLKLSEVVGQEHVTTALLHALQSGTISHAYLFTGPRGTGKTSIARILAHEINDLPYGDETPHLDIIEIDAASNRRIDEIRDLRDKVHIAPTSAKYKVYIIDEVHMLTREAFNALLKTLEEPPAYVVFILATTEVHKLPETIISRTQRYAFKPVPLAKVAEHLRHIARAEKIDIAPEALELIAAHGEGSFRDSISLLDQIRNTGKQVTQADAEAMLGIAPTAIITQLIDAVAAHDVAALVQLLTQAKEQGYEPARLAKQLGQRVRERLLDDKTATLDRETSLLLLAKLIDVPASPDPRTYFEIVLLDTAMESQTKPAPVGAAQAAATRADIALVAPAKKPSSVKPKAPRQHADTQAAPAKESAGDAQEAFEPAPGQTIEPTAVTAAKPSTLDASTWQHILADIKKHHSTLYSILNAASASFEPDLIRLEFAHAFHQKRAHDTKNQQLLLETAQRLTGQKPRIECLLVEKSPAARAFAPSNAMPAESQSEAPTKATPRAALSAQSEGDSLDTISNIFGGAELLQS